MMFNFRNYIGVFLFCFTITLTFLLLPKQFIYNSDVRLSPYGMALAIGYLEIPFSISKGVSGYVNNGIFSVYANWPPVGFMVLAIWLKVFGNSVLSARLLFLLINGLNTSLFYTILKKHNVSQYLAGLGAFLFLVLPYHLTYNTLIFADSWLLFFWIILLLIFSSSTKWKTLLMVVVSLVGTLFTWHVILILPAFFTLHFLLKLPTKQKIALVLGLGLLIVLSEIIFIQLFSYHHLVERLKIYSIIEMINNPGTLGFLFFKRIICLGLECLPLGILCLIQYKTFSFAKMPNLLKQSLVLIGITLFYYLLIFPSWFALHTHQIMMFDIFIGLCVIAVLLQWKSQISITYISFVLGLCSIILYFIIPSLSKQNYKFQTQDESIVFYVNKVKDSEKKACLFFHLPNKNVDNPVAEIFAIRNSCNAYTFEQLSTQNELPIIFIEQNVEKVKQLNIMPVEEKTVFLISEISGLIPSQKIVDSLVLDKIKVYKIKLKK